MQTENISILVIGCDQSKLKQQTALISSLINKDLVNQHLLESSNPTLPFKQKNAPDILIFLLDKTNPGILRQLGELPQTIKPSLIVITAKNDSELMRLSMRAGARDFFSDPVDESELQSALKLLISDRQTGDIRNGVLTTIINAKGGSGGSLVSCNLAHIASSASDCKTLLLDMDLQFGTQSLLLDLHPEHSIVDALSDIEMLDSSAIEGYMARSKSGLRLCTTLNDQVILPGEVSLEHINKFIALSLRNYDRVFIDLPRLIDPLSAVILEKSDQIVIVVQQTLAHMRDAKRLVYILKSELNITERNIFIVINRFSPQSSLQSQDIQTSIGCSNILNIPNDYERVATTTNLGIPLFDYSRKAPITKAMLNLAGALDVEIDRKYKDRSFLKHIFVRN